MESDKNLEKQAGALKEEDLDRVAGGMRTHGSLNPHCPKCGLEMFIAEINGAPSNFAYCSKCSYECRLMATLI
ncbi:hypothetical protein [Oscillibacter sp. GMB15532]|jgi:ribosomal protein S27AE|uniref:hypothetical protein n=1 Tax=Oscillibacter sp. GMB15532 TaxID=3230022 RepID=UPI0034E03E2F